VTDRCGGLEGMEIREGRMKLRIKRWMGEENEGK
jgi:hypothetical protein